MIPLHIYKNPSIYYIYIHNVIHLACAQSPASGRLSYLSQRIGWNSIDCDPNGTLNLLWRRKKQERRRRILYIGRSLSSSCERMVLCTDWVVERHFFVVVGSIMIDLIHMRVLFVTTTGIAVVLLTGYSGGAGIWCWSWMVTDIFIGIVPVILFQFVSGQESTMCPPRTFHGV